MFTQKKFSLFLGMSDTDSVYLACSAKTLEEVIKPEMREKYEEVKSDWFPSNAYEKRTPGLFKVNILMIFFIPNPHSSR